MPSHYPFMPFFVSDWLSDEQLSACEPASRGVWIDLLACMWRAGRAGVLIETPAALARMARCTPDELVVALKDLHNRGAADVVQHQDGRWTVKNRRMIREDSKRQLGTDRVRKYRRRQKTTRAGNATNQRPATPKHRAITGNDSDGNALATPDVTPAVTLKSRGRSSPPTPFAAFAADLSDFLYQATEVRVWFEDLVVLIIEFGKATVVAACERRAELRAPFAGLDLGPLAGLRSDCSAKRKPKQPGAFKTFQLQREREAAREVDRAEHRELAAQAQPVVDLPREVRAQVVDMYERTVKPLDNSDNLKFGRGSVIGLLADESRQGFAEEAAALAVWMATDAQAQALLRGSEVPA